MYSSQDYENAKAMVKKRWIIASVPACLIFAAAVAVFVWGNSIRSEKMWMVTAAMTVLSGAWFLFFYGVFVKPARIYRKHVDYMLNGRMRVTEGILTMIAADVTDHDGLDCLALNVNVGEKNDPVDDRTLYLDIYKTVPETFVGKHVRVLSNDKMVSAIELQE